MMLFVCSFIYSFLIEYSVFKVYISWPEECVSVGMCSVIVLGSVGVLMEMGVKFLGVDRMGPWCIVSG